MGAGKLGDGYQARSRRGPRRVGDTGLGWLGEGDGGRSGLALELRRGVVLELRRGVVLELVRGVALELVRRVALELVRGVALELVRGVALELKRGVAHLVVTVALLGEHLEREDVK